jgi:hypothetical protein
MEFTMNLYILKLYKDSGWLWHYDPQEDTNVFLDGGEYAYMDAIWRRVPVGAWLKCHVSGDTEDIHEFWESFCELLRRKPYVLSF